MDPKTNLNDARINEIAQNMLKRYSTPKVAHEMALLHAADSVQPEHWRAVAKRIQALASVQD